jgi:hypothetical protein
MCPQLNAGSFGLAAGSLSWQLARPQIIKSLGSQQRLDLPLSQIEFVTAPDDSNP